MIPKTTASNHLALAQKQPQAKTPAWLLELKQAIGNPDVLCQQLDLDPRQLPGGREGLDAGARLFKTRVPRSFLQRMNPGDPLDPLLLQVLPTAQEAVEVKGFTADPLQEQAYNPLPGLIHKYHSRVLLTLSGACAVNCRYCFRRHFPYADNSLGLESMEAVLAYLQARPQINEVIFSGGDPLLVSDARLQKLTRRLVSLPQLQRLRIHTRLPVVIPARVTDDLLAWLQAPELARLQKVIVVHINHPQELDEALGQALQQLTNAGVTLLNQSVLLRGVNDNVKVLTDLSEKLFACGVLPYYLHTLDAVAGAAHFALETARIKSLYSQLLACLPGFLVPRLVTEEADQPSKTPLGW